MHITIRYALLWIITLAVLLRLLSALMQGDQVQLLPGIYDQVSYDQLARRVVGGYGFSFGEAHWPATRAGEPTAHWSYLYTGYLAAIYSLFGAHPIAARIFQAILGGILHSWLIFRLGRHLFSPVIGAIAAGMSAVYVYFFYYGGALMTEPYYIVSILWSFDVALRLGVELRKQQAATSHISAHTISWRLWSELGLALGTTLLLRQVFMLFIPFMFLWLLWLSWQSARMQVQPYLKLKSLGYTLQSVAPGLVMSVCIIAIMILPWTIRNYYAFHTFVPLNTNSGFAFFWGNHPIYGTEFPGILPADGPTYLDLIPPELLELNEAELDKALLNEGIGFVVQDPQRYVLLSLSRFREYFKFWPTESSGLISNIARVGSFGLYFPFILYGLYLTLRNSHRSSWILGSFSEFVLLYLFIIVYAGVHILTWTLIRYRVPIDSVLVLFAAFAVTTLLEKFISTISVGKQKATLLRN